MSRTLRLLAIAFACCVAATAQTNKTFSQGGLSFDYPSNWTLQDISNKDAQQYGLTTDADVQIVVFVHQGRITPEKLPDAKKAFIDPYIAARTKQLQDMGAKTEQPKPEASEIGGVKADGVIVNASLGGQTGAAKIYWAIVGQRVVVLTLFGPDNQTKQLTPAWDLIRTSLKVVDPKAAPSPSPTPSPE